RVVEHVKTFVPKVIINEDVRGVQDVFLHHSSYHVDTDLPTKEYIAKKMMEPLFDPHAIKERQEVWIELQESPELRGKLVKVKEAADRLKFQRQFERVYNNSAVQQLENARLLVDFVESIEGLGGNVRSGALKQLIALGKSFAAHPRFSTLRRFVREAYE